MYAVVTVFCKSLSKKEVEDEEEMALKNSWQ